MSEPSKALIAQFRRSTKTSGQIRRDNWERLQERLADPADPPLPDVPALGPPSREPAGARTGSKVVPIAIAVAIAAAVLLGWRFGPWTPDREAVVRDATQAVDQKDADRPRGAWERRSSASRATRSAEVKPEPAPTEASAVVPPSSSQKESPPDAAGQAGKGRAGEPDMATDRDRDATRGARVGERDLPQNGGADPDTSPSPEQLAAELALVREAERALEAGKPDRALALVAKHAKRFESGILEPERRAIQVRAQCALGLHAQASASARAFRAAFPDSGVANALATHPCREKK